MPNPSSRQPAYAYLITALCFSIQALGIGTYIAFGVFFNPLMEAFGWSRAAISGASSTAFLSMGLFGMMVGRLNDRFGPRRLMSVAALLLGLGCLLMARVTTLWELYLFFGIIFGMGLSAIDVIALTTIARWFTHRRGFMTGIVKVGTGAGQFFIPLLAGALILLYGWRWAIAIIGIGVTLILLLMAQLLRRDPGASGLTSRPVTADRALTATDPGLSLSQVFRTVQLWTICMLNMFLVFCLMIIMLHIVPYARDVGIPHIQAAGILSTIGAVSMLGRFVCGLIIDRRGSKPVMSFCFFLLLVDLVWLQFAHQLWMLYLFGALYGLAHGGCFTAISPLVAEWFGIRFHGTLFGVVVFFGTLGGATGPLLAGYLFDISGNYALAFRIVTLVALFAWALLLTLRPMRISEHESF
ncbi:MFS transporter [Desulfatitalea alkaliphila]|uniref:MFS transporter n=1 Tax=Desulfatitalea alkaliphila TaxID=2929485 RepID=A0AA41UKP5_9BACT|nr:MFS transporter [Desulfatitalea alkaliphila]MCJ8501642.1 MFS transporter [Desulfatitalea alkaliphila]